jgi:hypothetical protein
VTAADGRTKYHRAWTRGSIMVCSNETLSDSFVEYRFYYKCWSAGVRPPTICTKSSLAHNA